METQYPISQVLARYNMSANHDLLYSYEELRSIGVEQSFIYTLLQTFDEEHTFSAADYDQYSLELIIDYIRRTHQFYLAKKLCEIEQSIQILLQDHNGAHPLLTVLNTFFHNYTAHLTAHVQAEEKYLLPYIECLLQLEKGALSPESFTAQTQQYSLERFINEHHDTEEDLSAIRQIILDYKAPVTNLTPYRILVSQLSSFEKDLATHALIEDEVLIPRALALEAKRKQ